MRAQANAARAAAAAASLATSRSAARRLPRCASGFRSAVPTWSDVPPVPSSAAAAAASAAAAPGAECPLDVELPGCVPLKGLLAACVRCALRGRRRVMPDKRSLTPSLPPPPCRPLSPRSLPRLRPARNLPSPQLQLTTLPSGLRVASQETYGQIATLALFVDAGSMYEAEGGACGGGEGRTKRC
jgi:hypothetical protein